MASGLREIFGMATTASFLRAGVLNISNTKIQGICLGMCQAFGLTETDGNSLYFFMKENANLGQTNGFGVSSYYANFEANVAAVINGYYPLQSQGNRDVLTVAVHGVIFSYALNTSINIETIVTLIGKTLQYVSEEANGSQVTRVENKIIIHPFTASVVLSLIGYPYSSVVADISLSAKTDQAPLVNYNWYDTNRLLAGPNLQTMKDVENQYYYISGQLLYQSIEADWPICITDTVIITTDDGPKTISYIRNTPCISPDTYVGPPTGTKFFRVFNDGPASSGDFSSEVKEAYQHFDRNILPKTDWQSNATSLTDTLGNVIFNGDTFTDTNGRYNIPQEYINAPDSLDCVSTYQRMHIGDNAPRRIALRDGFGKCTGSILKTVTGFKYVSLEVGPETWDQNLYYFRANPDMATGNVFKRSLNLDSNPYLATSVDGVYLPYTVEFSPYKEKWYIGPPQLNGASSLPTLGFYQKFDNTTFNDFMKVVLFPGISQAVGNTEEETSRSYVLSETPLLTGEQFQHFSYKNPSGTRVEFKETISSNLTGKDEIYHKFFAMGDAMEGKYSIVTTQEENAGFFYTGFAAYEGTTVVNLTSLVDSYSSFILGSPIKNFKYIKGFEHPLGDLSVRKQFGLNNSGDKIAYYYLDNRVLPQGVTLTPSTWQWFAPLPTDLDAKYNRVYSEQRVENYLPRYSHGPFSVEDRNFLYPHAFSADRQEIGKLHGFPNKLNFDLEIREETVKEIYCTYTITPEGLITTNPKFKPVLRTKNDVVDTTTITPMMFNIFVPNDPSYLSTYDFKKWQIGKDFTSIAGLDGVDNNWAPTVSGIIPSGRNNELYKRSIFLYGFDNGNLFQQGIKKTGDGSFFSKIFTGFGPTDFVNQYREKPMAVGLYHGYKSFSQNVTLGYTPPIFNLGSGKMAVTESLLEAFPVMNTFQTYRVETFTGVRKTIETGKDPLFFEFVGGRRGGPTAEAEGGYHSQGFIGDRWNGMSYEYYGTDVYTCFFNVTSIAKFYYRRPNIDSYVSAFNTSTSGTNLWIRGLTYNPVVHNQFSPTFKQNRTYPYTIGEATGTLTTQFITDRLQFNLSQYFPMKAGTGWYYPTGLVIGPFDRDVELGVAAPNQIVGTTELYVNGSQLTRLQYVNSCVDDYIRAISINTGIIPNEWGRNPDYTILATIFSGKSVTINVLSSGIEGYDVPTGVGLQPSGFLSIRAYNANYASSMDTNLHSGESSWLDPFLYTNNGLEKRFDLPHSNLDGLAGTREFITYSQSGKLYPVPEIDMTGMATIDTYGNLIYQSTDTVEQYWKNKARTLGKSITISGWREGSRLAITIKNFKKSFDTIPYQAYRLVIPSGECVVSGEMGYLAQADNTIFSEGFHLVNITQNDPTTGVYNPEYLSDVILRVPNLQTGLSGTVVKAPSVLKQRQKISGIVDGQSYDRLLTESPYNYNKLRWPAMSDLVTLNPGETIEEMPPDDGSTFTVSNIIYSASQGQLLPNGSRNPNIDKTFGTLEIYQMYDSIATDALVNSGKCLTSFRGPSIYLRQSEMSGALVPLGTSLSMIGVGLV
jgi:hypothetical protein